jgi:ATP-dependent Lhr-like helicase
VTTGAATYWVAAEHLPMLAAVFPDCSVSPPTAAPAEYAARAWSGEEAVRELVRGRLQAMGPVTSTSLAMRLGLEAARVQAALLALESEGFVLRGQFTPRTDDGAPAVEWCERRLLARIHRYTIRTLRAEIEPVSGADFMRFLLDWQGVTRDPRPEGPQGVAAVIEQLEGHELPAAAWEAEVLPARLASYESGWLDSLCLSGRVLWTRLAVPRAATAGPVRATPIALLRRQNWAMWQQLAQPPVEPLKLSSTADALAAQLRAHGASFFDELQRGTQLLASQVESGLGELVGAGLITADSFAGLRALLLPLERRRRLAARGRRSGLPGLEDAGRWSLVRRETAAAADDAALDAIAWLLLRRYGVVFRKLLAREAQWLPPWHALLRNFRRLEAQGHIRGGRFVAGGSGEQYALPDAVTSLRAVRKRATDGAIVTLSAADPLNLLGIVTPGPRLPALMGNRFALRDGVPVATLAAGEVTLLEAAAPADEWQLKSLLRVRRSRQQAG